MAAPATPRPGIGDTVRPRITHGATRLLRLSRSGSLIAIGSGALLVDGLRTVFGWARDARERQLERINGSLRRAVSRLWPGAKPARRSGARHRDGLEKSVARRSPQGRRNRRAPH